jgi:hypothetical protein
LGFDFKIDHHMFAIGLDKEERDVEGPSTLAREREIQQLFGGRKMV